ncbi:MAG: SpoIID/LytB domain-containing protein [Vampirovibrionales bacterium]|nr:SpoIID/LytB domain-containing protein [Vampirovibrionales bacterium]
MVALIILAALAVYAPLSSEAGFWHALARLLGVGSSFKPSPPHDSKPLPSVLPPAPTSNVPQTVPASENLASWQSSFLQNGLIRVGISDDAMSALEYPMTVLGATGAFTIRDVATDQLVFSASAGDRLQVRVDAQGFLLTMNNHLESLHVLGPLRVMPASDQSALQILNITRKGIIPQYRGTLEIIRGKNNPQAKLSVVNHLPLEDYLRAVVPNEMPVSFGLEALKAQAVAARNYAIRPRDNGAQQRYDICDSQACQVYFGKQSEHPLANQAIDATAGLVALYHAEPIVAMFSSTHGGYSEDYAHAFQDTKAYPYLKGKADYPEGLEKLLATIANDVEPSQAPEGWTDWFAHQLNSSAQPLSPARLTLQQEAAARLFWTSANAPSFDIDSPLNRWERIWRREELETSLSKTLADVSRQGSSAVQPAYPAGTPLGTLEQILVPERGVSGKAKVVLIVSNRGQWRVAKENIIRRVFAHHGKMLPSANIVFSSMNRPVDNGFGTPPALEIESVKVHGGGFGHGVGMSQYGAGFLARKAGLPFSKILQHYYEGISIGTKPLKVGGGILSPTSIEFRVPEPFTQAQLCVQVADDDQNRRDPVLMSLNGEARYVVLDALGGAKLPIAPFLKRPPWLNTMTLFPDASLPSRRLKAWIELVPALPEVQ